MRKIIMIILGVVFNCFHSQNLTDTENYVYKKTYLSAPSDPVQKQLESVQYLDGLGRPKQMISIKSTSLGNDLVVPIVYDQFGRKTKDYLPVPVQTSNAGIQSSVTESTVNSYYGVTNAFSEKELESSPLSRIFQSAYPGEDWKMTSGHTVKYDYDANSESDYVKKYSITTTWDNTNQIYISTPSTVSFYDENSLYKFSVKDEDHNEEIVFKDLYGHIVLIRKNDGTNNIDTYYIYDKYDHLAYVIPPLASVSSILSQDILDNLCYQYRYDNKKRLVEKKLPGKGWEFLVYDKHNRLVLSQDVLLRSTDNNFMKRGWLFTKYDQFGRIVYNGFFANTASRIAMQTALSNMSSLNNETRSETPFTLNGMEVYYTKNAFPTGSMTILGIEYYDTYPPLPAGITIPSYIIKPQQTVLTQNAQSSSRSTKSLSTASYIKNIEDDQWTRNFVWYNNKGQIIGTHSLNHLGGYTKTESELDFTGTPQQVRTYHKRLDADYEKVVLENFEYDAQNRLKKHWHEATGHSKELLSDNTYNEISELANTKIGGNGTNPLQSVDYKYNIRGWLTGVNNPNNLGGSLFGYEIKYQDPVNIANILPKYNGNISEVSWKTANGSILKRYNYKYDGLNRLKDATYSEPLASVPLVNGYGESLTYDLNGNIKTLKRFSGMYNNPVLIDNLDYITYSGNQLIKVVDNSNNPLGYPSGGNAISYDANGNMTSQIDKGFYGIKYNYLDLPNHILFDQASSSPQNTNLKFLYRADGVKLKKSYTYFVPRTNIWITNETDYLDGFQYNGGGQLQFVPTANGYYDFAYNRYVYQYKDQVGNIRLSYYHDGNKIVIDKETNYYPFGMEYSGGNGTYPLNRSYTYGFQEQERQEETGWNSFKWRNYDSTLGRFFNVDPLSEVYAYQSHYNFSENWVIDAREIEGLEAEKVNSTGYQGGIFEGSSNSSEGVTSLMKDNSGGTIGANIQTVDLGTFPSSTFTSGIGNGFTDTFRGIGNFISDPIGGIGNAVSNYTWNDYGNSLLNTFSFGLYGQLGGLQSFGGNLINNNYYNAGYQTGEVIAGAALTLATDGAGRGLGKLKGSGPTAGVIEVSENVKSVSQFQNYFPKNGMIEFIFNTENNTFLVGKPKNTWTSGLSGHQNLVKSLMTKYNSSSNIVGGMFKRDGNTILTDEFSGHFGQNWTNQNRMQFKQFMEKSTGLKVNHTNFGN